MEQVEDKSRLATSRDSFAVGSAKHEGNPLAHSREYLIEPLEEPSRPALQARPDSVIHIVVPFYKKEALVAPLFASLNAIVDELSEIRAKVFFYNDSPDYEPLQVALDRCRFDGPEVEFTVIRNRENLGFVGTCNAAFAKADRERADVILLNSDTLVFPGAFREILEVSRLDPMIGFVSPRSNNATLATLPHSSLDCEVTPQDGYRDFKKYSAFLPRFSYTPTAVGFCFYVRWAIFSELGTFDPVYGKGYNEENDLVLRANRCGYRAVLANHAFVWHQGEQSFAHSAGARSEREDKNAPILRSRYPEYLPLIRAHFASPEFCAEDLLEYVDPKTGDVVFAFDFSTFGPYFNGTFESGIKLLEAAVRTWPKQVNIAVYISTKAWEFHGLDRLPGVRRLDVDDETAKVAAIVRVGQPFEVETLARIIRRAPVIGIFMLDTISYDCGYLSLTFDHKVWRYVFEYIDVVFTNSRFTLERIALRFKLGPRVLRRVSRHSLDVTEYGSPHDRTPGAKPHIFVIGNHFDHKFVRKTADAVAAAFPEQKVVAVGYGRKASPYANVAKYESGHLTNEVFERFYSDAAVVIFPSHYEGFGFPILHSLARKRPICVRDSALYRELATEIEGGAENIHYFSTSADLVAQLRQHDLQWIEPVRSGGEKGGWDRSAREVYEALVQARATVTYDALVERLRRFDDLASSCAAAVPTFAKRVGLRVEAMVDGVLNLPGVKPFARRCLHAYSRLRRN